MTREDREKAIEILRADSISSYSVEDILGARDSAIKALEQESTTKNGLGVDLISRSDVFQILWNYDYTNPSALIVNAIRELPSVTPQEPTDKNLTKADIDAIVKAINAHWELIIDEIRAEIETEKLEDSPNFYIKAHNIAVDRVLQILDKYKAESEEADE